MSAMGDVYIEIAERAGIELEDEDSIDLISDALAHASGTTVADYVRTAVDYLAQSIDCASEAVN